MVADDFRDDEIEEFFGKGRVEPAQVGQVAQARDLRGFACLVGGRHIMLGFEDTNGLGSFEAFSQRVQKHRIEIVDCRPQMCEFVEGVICTHFFGPPSPGGSPVPPRPGS